MGDVGVDGLSPPSPQQESGLHPGSMLVDDDGIDQSPKTPLRRQMARKYWQPNSEASSCAIESCGTTFGSWNVLSGRHHCRACGRVVCASCSLGSRVMNPPRGEAGGPSTVRVCDACFRFGQTFDFQPSPSSHSRSLRGLRRQNSEEMLKSLHDDYSPRPSESGLRPIASAPNMQLDWARNRQLHHEKSRRSTVGKEGPDAARDRRTSGPSDDDEHSASDTVVASSEASAIECQGCDAVVAPKPCDIVTMPQEISPNKGMGPRRESSRTIEQLADNDAELMEKFKKMETSYAHSSYYQGLLEHEPQALKALLMSEVCAQKRPQATEARDLA